MKDIVATTVWRRGTEKVRRGKRLEKQKETREVSYRKEVGKRLEIA